MSFEEFLIFILPALGALVLAAIVVAWQGYETRRFDEERRRQAAGPDRPPDLSGRL